MPLANNLKPDDDAPTTDVKTKADILTSIKELLESPEFIDKVNQRKILKRPPHASKLSNFSYYRESFALEMKLTIDAMIDDKKDRIWKYSDYPDLSPSTLYQRIIQSLNYLLRELDFDGTYKRYRDMMVIVRDKANEKNKDRAIGIKICWIRDKLEGRSFKGSVIEDRDKVHEWKIQVEEFLANDEERVLHLKRLALSYEQIKHLEVAYGNVEGLLCVFTDSEIKMVKEGDVVSSQGDEYELPPKEDEQPPI